MGLPSIRTAKQSRIYISLYIFGFTMALFQTAWIVWEIRKNGGKTI